MPIPTGITARPPSQAALHQKIPINCVPQDRWCCSCRRFESDRVASAFGVLARPGVRAGFCRQFRLRSINRRWRKVVPQTTESAEAVIIAKSGISACSANDFVTNLITVRLKCTWKLPRGDSSRQIEVRGSGLCIHTSIRRNPGSSHDRSARRPILSSEHHIRGWADKEHYRTRH